MQLNFWVEIHVISPAGDSRQRYDSLSQFDILAIEIVSLLDGYPVDYFAVQRELFSVLFSID